MALSCYKDFPESHVILADFSTLNNSRLSWLSTSIFMGGATLSELKLEVTKKINAIKELKES